jgi:hypothetical protein
MTCWRPKGTPFQNEISPSRVLKASTLTERAVFAAVESSDGVCSAGDWVVMFFSTVFVLLFFCRTDEISLSDG